MVFATITVIKPHQPEKVSRVSNAAAKYHGLAFNDKLLSGRHLLQKLTGIIFGFREQQIALLANKEAIFYKLLSQAMTIDVYRRPRAIIRKQLTQMPKQDMFAKLTKLN